MNINDCLTQLVEALEDRGAPFPLELAVTPADLLSLLADDSLPARERSPLGIACTTLLATLESEGIPDPLHQPFTIALIWLDLCHFADEKPPTVVEAMLDMPAARPLFDEGGGADRARPRVIGSGHSVAMLKRGDGGW